MPNWCENELTVQTQDDDKESTKQMKEFNKILFKDIPEDDKYNPINGMMNQFIPEPDELKDIHHGYITIEGKTYKQWIKKDGVPTPLDDPESLMKKYGATNLYDWHVNNYGCKWDVEAEIIDADDPQYTMMRFSSPWCPPIEFLEFLAEKFPKLHIRCKYEEEGQGFMGCAKGVGYIEDQCIDTY